MIRTSMQPSRSSSPIWRSRIRPSPPSTRRPSAASWITSPSMTQTTSASPSRTALKSRHKKTPQTIKVSGSLLLFVVWKRLSIRRTYLRQYLEEVPAYRFRIVSVRLAHEAQAIRCQDAPVVFVFQVSLVF